MLEKNKDYIELKAACCSADYCQGYMTHLDITGYSNSDLATPLPNPGTDYILISKDKFEALQTENEQLKKKLEEFSQVPGYREFLTALYPEGDVEKLVWVTEQICCGQVSVNGWMASAKLWKGRYNDLSKLVGFSSEQEIEDYLVNEAECDTLHEAILKLKDQVKYTCDEWYSANSTNNSWKAAAECNSPKELREKLNLLRDNIEEWKEATGYPNPSSAKTAIESGASWCLAYNKVKKKYDQALEIIREWQLATRHYLPEVAGEELADLKKEVSDYKEQIKSLYKIIEGWNKVTGCSTPEEAKDWVNELGEANGNLAQNVLSWQEVTGFKTPKEAKDYWVTKLSESGEVNESFAREVRSWHEITGFSTPEKCSSYIDTLEEKLEEIKNLIEED